MPHWENVLGWVLWTVEASWALSNGVIPVSQESYIDAILLSSTNPKSIVECAAMCSKYKGCTSWSWAHPDCEFLNGSVLVPQDASMGPTKRVFVEIKTVDGVWTEWSTSSPCSRSCGTGLQTRHRTCSAPMPLFGGLPCPSGALEGIPCNAEKCLGSGDWHPMDMCQASHGFANGFDALYENEYPGDNSALNAVRLRCDGGGMASSGIGAWGGYGPLMSCPLGYTQAKVRIDPLSGGDNRGTTCVELYCLTTSSWQRSSCGNIGDWSEQSCPPGEKICGIRTKVQKPQGGGDDTALNDVIFQCCHGYPL